MISSGFAFEIMYSNGSKSASFNLIERGTRFDSYNASPRPRTCTNKWLNLFSSANSISSSMDSVELYILKKDLEKSEPILNAFKKEINS